MIRSLIAAIFVLFTFNANAALITSELTEDNYVTYEGLDWAWVSDINWSLSGNTILAPDYDDNLHEGWRYATEDELTAFQIALQNDVDGSILQMFELYDDQGTFIGYKQAISYWNTQTEYLYDSAKADDDNIAVDTWSDIDLWDEYHHGIGLDDLLDGNIVSQLGATLWTADLFYVRSSNQNDDDGVSVPEPSSILLLALALIGISLRARR